MRKKIELEIENTNPYGTVLKNSNEDTFFFDPNKHEEFSDFLHGANKLPINNVSPDWGFIDWLKRGMWTQYEDTTEHGLVRKELWYNTHNYAAMEKPLHKEELYELYKNSL